MKTSETASIRESTEKILKFLDINYEKEDPVKAESNAVKMNYEESTELLGLLK